MAGIESDKITMDGKSLLPAMIGKKETSKEWRTQVYIEYDGIETIGRDVLKRIQRGPNNTFIGIRRITNNDDYSYSEFDISNHDFLFLRPYYQELYYLNKDPYQLNNIIHMESIIKIQKLNNNLHGMLNCSGNDNTVVGSCFVTV